MHFVKSSATQEISKKLSRRTIAEALSGTMIDKIDSELELLVSHISKRSTLWKELAKQTIRVLIGATLPGRRQVAEIDVHSCQLGQ